MKSGPIIRMGFLIASVLAVGVAIHWLDHVPAYRLASILGIHITVSDIKTPAPSSATVSPTPITAQIPGLSLGSVAIQTFSGTHLLQTTTGTFVSSDGLIIAIAHMVPYGSGSYVYQVTTSRGLRERAVRVYTDSTQDLVLLKIGGAEQETVSFSDVTSLQTGDHTYAVGATIVPSQYIPVVLPVDVVYTTPSGFVALSIDPTYAAISRGLRVLDDEGVSVGILGGGIRPILVSGAAINRAIAAYLSLPH